MTTLLLIIHIIVCVVLIGVVLLQSGKGAEIGAAFGGSSQTLFGSRGAATFLSKVTTVVAIIFMLTSLALAIIQTKSSTIIKDTVPTEQKEVSPQKIPQQPLQPQQTPTPQK